jgi:hypothetical protein
MPLAVVRRVSSWEEAIVVASAFRSAGIEAEVFDILGQMQWTLQTALGGFRVMVSASQLGDARDFLRSPPPPGDDGEPAIRSRSQRAHTLIAVVLLAFFG